MKRRGFTIMELLVAMTILMAILSFAIPNYRVAAEQSRLDLAASNLLTVYTAQRMYWVDNATFADDLTKLINAKLLDGNFAPGKGLDSKYTYSIVSATASTFQARALRTSDYWDGTITIDQTGVITGTLVGGQIPDTVTITPSRYPLGL